MLRVFLIGAMVLLGLVSAVHAQCAGSFCGGWSGYAPTTWSQGIPPGFTPTGWGQGVPWGYTQTTWSPGHFAATSCGCAAPPAAVAPNHAPAPTDKEALPLPKAAETKPKEEK